LTLAIAMMFSINMISAEPAGTLITFNQTVFGQAIDPANRTDDGGSITTLVVDALQQTTRWKAYIGNITGTLTLDDSTGNTIFQWALDETDVTGEIYSSTSNSV